MRGVARAREPLHAHILARQVVHDRREHRAFVRLVHLERIAAVRDRFALVADLDPGRGGLSAEPVLRILSEAGGGIHLRGFAFHRPIMRPSGSVKSENLPMPGTFCSSTWIFPPAASTFLR